MTLTDVPAKLKAADISRFAVRAGQVEKFEPPVAYWCYYWIVQQILEKGLHNSDDECKQYTTKMMDKLEEIKTKFSYDDRIIDDVAGQAFVEKFGLDTFQRADNGMRANKSSERTIDTFRASVTFLDLLTIWGPQNPEVATKIKFAKVHALRIAKALKAGEDPNLTNPAPDPPPEPEDVALNPSDPEVQAINAGGMQPYVEEVTDEQSTVQQNMPVQSPSSNFIHPARASSLPREQSMWPPQSDRAPSQNVNGVSPLPQGPIAPAPNASAASMVSPPAALPISPSGVQSFSASRPDSNPRQSSIGGGYFPQVQASPPAQVSDPPAAPMHHAPGPSPLSNPQNFYTNPAEQFSPPVPHLQTPSNAPPRASPQIGQNAPNVPAPIPLQPQQFVAPHPQQPAQQYSVPSQPTAIPPNANTSQNYNTDEDAVVDAQKHAKWAISALNFEDVPTAVKELRTALKSLGAS